MRFSDCRRSRCAADGGQRERGACVKGGTERARTVRVTEIFHSIQGESTWAGLPCTFVRLTGCPLRCVWCDTAYAFHGGTRMDVDEVVAAVREKGCRLVEITGGEPLVQPGAATLAVRLVVRATPVLVETSGAGGHTRAGSEGARINGLSAPAREEARNLVETGPPTARDENQYSSLMEPDSSGRDVIRRRGLIRVCAGDRLGIPLSRRSGRVTRRLAAGSLERLARARLRPSSQDRLA